MMGWLRNLFSVIARGIAWGADATTFCWNAGLKMFSTLWGRAILMIVPLVSVLWTSHKFASYISQPIRNFFIHGAHSGFSGGSFNFSAIVTNWVGVLNYCFPLDEMLQILIHMALIIFGLWASLSIFRLAKSAIGGWL